MSESDAFLRRQSHLSPTKKALFEKLMQGKIRANAIQKRQQLGSEPLSFAQERLWFFEQFNPHQPLYNEPIALRLLGTLNAIALQQSLNEIVRRHEVLRTTFATVEGQPIQVIAPTLTLAVPTVNLQSLSPKEQEVEVKRIATEEAKQPFNLVEGPLVRVTLLQLSEAEHILLLTMHHIICDRWSFGVLIREVAALYEAFTNGQRSPLSELSIQYADYAIWQRQWLVGEVLEKQTSYWLQQLDNAPTLLELFTDRPRPAVMTYQGAKQSFVLPKQLSEALKALSQQEGTTLFMTLLAAFKTLLYHYTQQEDILVGTPIAGRNRAELEGLIGFFVNTLVLRTCLADNPSFRELLGRVREVTLGAYAHQDLPFEQLVEKLHPERNLSHTPLFQVMFQLHNTPTSSLELPGLTLMPLEFDNETAKFDLTLAMVETEQGIIGNLKYNTQLFNVATVSRMIRHFQTLVQGIVANPDRLISHLPLLTDAEQHQLLIEWNDTQTDYPCVCIHQLFEAQVEQTPDAVAVVFEDQQLTYQQLNARANQLAHYLQKLGTGPEVLVGIYMERSLEMVVGILGILKAGGAYVPLDPTYPQERLAFMLEDAQVPVLLTQHHLVETLPSHQAYVICLDTDWEAIIAQQPQENPTSGVTLNNSAYVIYTSGSTGKPKGAINTHMGICNRLLWMQNTYQLTQADSVLQKTPFSFDVSVWEFFLPLLSGARLVFAQPGGHQDSAYLVKLIAQEQITTLHFVPSMLQVFLEAAGLEQCHCIKRVICSGEALSFELQQRFFACLDAELHNLYGPTEAAIDVTFWTCQRQSDLPIVLIGRPITNTQIYLLDCWGQPVPIGVPGELYIGGKGLARGYLNRPELTAQKFIPNPFGNKLGTRLYRTGDLARYLPSGEIEFIGRIDHQVKIRGFRIELGEIEAILNQHAHVRQAVVVASEDVGDKRLVAYVSLQQTVTVTELRSFLQEKLPEYMIPSAFVVLPAIPLTANGKVDRRALPAPDQLRPELENIFVVPHTPVEEMLAGIWVKLLGVEQVGIHDNFFELGGHSLLAIRFLSQLREVLEVELPLRSLFESPTIAELAQKIEAKIRAGQKLDAPIQPATQRENLPLSFAQQRLWFIDQLAPGNPGYNIPAAVRLHGSLNVTALEQSLNEIVRRHEALRTTFKAVDGRPMQVITPTLKLTLPVIDLQALAQAEQETEVLRLIAQEAQQPFNLACGPLLRITLLKLSAREHVVLFTMHHIISDGWSMGVLIREVATLYQAFLYGKPSPLPELPIQYADFAVWQRQWLQGEVLQTQLAYWKQHLGGSLPVLQLPYSQPRPATPSNTGGIHTFKLSAKLSEALLALSHEANATLFMTMLAALQTLLHRYTGQDDIVVGTDVANRNRAEVEPLIGFFVNLFVLRTDLGGYPSFRELLQRVREVAMSAYAHQDLPFEKLVEELQPERHQQPTPLFQVLFVQNVPTQKLELEGLTLIPLEADNKRAKFDLALFVSETEEGIVGRWHYNADIFDKRAIAQIAGHYETLLNSIVAQPDARINTLEMLTADEKQQQIMTEVKQEQSKLKKFMGVKPKAVKLPQGELIKTDYLQPTQTLPLVIQPNIDDIDLIDWAKSNRQFIETKLQHHGAILLRGFNIDSVLAFENLAQAICPELFAEYGDLPREGVGGKVYGSTPYPSDQAILFHNESSHMHCYPLKIWFFCVQPAQQGGETPIVDCRKVYQLLNPKLQEIFEKKQLMYVRNYIEGLDVSWQEFFHTTDKAVVQEYCCKAGIEFEWLPNNGLRTRKLRPAVVKHIRTGEKVFFNQLQLHHVSCLNPSVRESLLSIFGEENLPRNVYYGDGSPIEDAVMAEINEVYKQAAISFPWQQKDVLMLDNMLTAHGRYPYVGPRKIVVAMGEMIQSENAAVFI
ncbi:non-ribosomal peptide synthetase [Mastigocladopsis repens]|uniref:non-ribosomal peptide synthetase n=1 Tax=Mastigocladopsis repens TaxID=221287 RepID=UPI00037FF239|nr:non-ribosomal peptide synthetase [Mastigocladopsis repens]